MIGPCLAGDFDAAESLPAALRGSEVLVQEPPAGIETNPWSESLASLVHQPLPGDVRISGWMDTGYTYATSGAGPLAVAPQLNYFGREFLLNQLAIDIEKPLDANDWSWGYFVQFFGGADASTLQGPGDINNSNPRFGGTVRQARVQAHLPILFERGIDLQFGRQGSAMGYESYMAPLRPFYSFSYQWVYAEDGADTGCWATLHASECWDVMYGVTLGSNTFFTLRGDAPCHVMQFKRWLDADHKFYHCATLLVGDQAIGNSAPAFPGTLATVLEWRIQFLVNERLTQVFQANVGWDGGVPSVGTGQWHGLVTNSVLKLHDSFDAQLRLEWFDDVNGTRTGIATNYYAITSGIAARLGPRLTVRPELRGDFAGGPAFGPVSNPSRQSQLTAAVECVLTF